MLEIQSEGSKAAPHLSCIASTKDDIRAILHQYQAHGIRHIVALRGDLPSGTVDSGELRYANDLVQFIRRETGDIFNIEVAAYPEFHPQARTAQENLLHFKMKIDAGANAAITQYFFNADAYFNFVDECEAMGINIPIVPGIMPINNFAQLARFSDTCGAEIPRWLRLKLQSYGEDVAGSGPAWMVPIYAIDCCRQARRVCISTPLIKPVQPRRSGRGLGCKGSLDNQRV